MGRCTYCGDMIYLDWIAERGYHRVCHEEFLKRIARSEIKYDVIYGNKAKNRAEKRRIRRREIRRLKKGKAK